MPEDGQRRFDRRASEDLLHERAMRCDACGTVWYSAVADVAAVWARCIHCGGRLHRERRSGAERRGALSRLDVA